MNSIRFIYIVLITLASLLNSSCKREVTLTPPAGARVIKFIQNTHVNNRAIYQGQADGVLKSGDTSHTCWMVITRDMLSHRIHAINIVQFFTYKSRHYFHSIPGFS